MRNFWEDRAKEYGGQVGAVNFDSVGEELAPMVLESLVQDGESVCDLGCGNGRTVMHLARVHRNSRFLGLDYAANMIAAAKEARKREGLENVAFLQLDAGTEDLAQQVGRKFDKVVTKRLLINVKGMAKRRVVENVHSLLAENGVYVLMECFLEPLERINEMRRSLGLADIRVKEFNEYLDAKFLDVLGEWFTLEQRIDYESLYYFISRVFNAKLSEGAPDYHAPMNKLAIELVRKGFRVMEGYAPEVALVLRRK